VGDEAARLAIDTEMLAEMIGVDEPSRTIAWATSTAYGAGPDRAAEQCGLG